MKGTTIGHLLAHFPVAGPHHGAAAMAPNSDNPVPSLALAHSALITNVGKLAEALRMILGTR